MNILVTGSTGFIGANLTKKLVQKGYKTRVLVRENSKLDKISGLPVEIIYGDLTDLGSLMKALKDIDIVFNLAAGLPHHKLSEHEYKLVNVDGVKNLIEASIKNKIKRLIHISTVGIYGPTDIIGFNEKSKLNLTDPYTKTKAQGDNLIFDAVKKNKFPAIIIRPTIAYGPGDTRPGFSNLFPLINKGIFIPIGNCNNYFHTIYIENLINALLITINKKNIIGGDFIIGDDPCPKMIDVLKAIVKAEQVSLPNYFIPIPIAMFLAKIFEIGAKFGFFTPLNIQRVNFITQNRRYNIDKAKKMLGYIPQVGLDEGMRETFLWYKEHGYIR